MEVSKVFNETVPSKIVNNSRNKTFNFTRNIGV